MENKTINPHIVVSPTTKTQLGQQRLVESETYDSVVVRALEALKNEKRK